MRYSWQYLGTKRNLITTILKILDTGLLGGFCWSLWCFIWEVAQLGGGGIRFLDDIRYLKRFHGVQCSLFYRAQYHKLRMCLSGLYNLYTSLTFDLTSDQEKNQEIFKKNFHGGKKRRLNTFLKLRAKSRGYICERCPLVNNCAEKLCEKRKRLIISDAVPGGSGVSTKTSGLSLTYHIYYKLGLLSFHQSCSFWCWKDSGPAKMSSLWFFTV